MVRTISMRQLEGLLESGRRFTLLDVREREVFQLGYLDGALNIPLEELEDRSAEIPREVPVIIYCEHGSQSLIAARYLDDLGYQTASAVGGLSYYCGRHLVAT